MASPITGFILIFQNLGLNQAAVQSKTITPAQTNALFWVNIAASAIVSLVFLVTSPLVGLFYGDIRPGQVMAASAATVLITGLSLQHTALLNRNMKFKQIAVVDIANVVTTLGATAISAYLLRSYWAIWIGTKPINDTCWPSDSVSTRASSRPRSSPSPMMISREGVDSRAVAKA